MVGFDIEDLSPTDIAPTARPVLISEDDRLADKIREHERLNLTEPKSFTDALFGHGIGASFDRGGLERPIKPWQTELQYHAMFYWTGLVGLILLASTFMACVRAIRQAYRLSDPLNGVLFVSCVGAAATLIGNATNPYLQAPGHMWPIFLPFMIASVILVAQPSKTILTRPFTVRLGSKVRMTR